MISAYHQQRNRLFKTLCCGLFLSAAWWLNAQSPAHGRLRKGDRLYDEKSYLQAESTYSKAPADPVALYNAGNAAFQQGKYATAADWYQKAAATLDLASARSDAFYNLGNACMLQGKLQEAIVAYESSLRLRPNRPDAKKNLQIARNKLREQQEPPPPPPPQKPPPPPPPRNNYVDRAQLPQQKETPSGNMTADAARQILNATIDREEQKNARQYRALPPEARPSRTKKDW